MKNVINKIKNSKGFVSVEAILVIGAVILLAGVIIYFTNGKASDVSSTSGAAIDTASDATLANGEAVDGAKGTKGTFGTP